MDSQHFQIQKRVLNIVRDAGYFASHFGQDEYGRLAVWFRTMSHHAMVTALLAIKPGCDTRAIRTHLEQQIFDRLNRVYVPS